MSIELSLRPYPGKVIVCKSRKEYRRESKRMLGGDGDTGILDESSGRVSYNNDTYCVWAESPAYMAHELGHVLLRTFSRIGSDPTEGGGEPFCYMLSQLMLECAT